MRDLVTPRELASDYQLDMFYNPTMGNIVIPDENCTEEVNARIREFLKDNPEWVLGHEETYWYLAESEDL